MIFFKDWDVRRQNQISKIGTNKQIVKSNIEVILKLQISEEKNRKQEGYFNSKR